MKQAGISKPPGFDLEKMGLSKTRTPKSCQVCFCCEHTRSARRIVGSLFPLCIIYNKRFAWTFPFFFPFSGVKPIVMVFFVEDKSFYQEPCSARYEKLWEHKSSWNSWDVPATPPGVVVRFPPARGEPKRFVENETV